MIASARARRLNERAESHNADGIMSAVPFKTENGVAHKLIPSHFFHDGDNMFAHTAEFPIAVARGGRRSWAASWSQRFYLLGIIAALGVSGAVDFVRSTPSTEASIPPGVIADFAARPSHSRLYRAEVVSASSLNVGVAQQWVVRLTGRNHRRLAHARVTVRTWMPMTDETSSRQATASYVGGGGYVLRNVLFTRPGWWNVDLVVDGLAGTDSVGFNVEIPRARTALTRSPTDQKIAVAFNSVPHAGLAHCWRCTKAAAPSAAPCHAGPCSCDYRRLRVGL